MTNEELDYRAKLKRLTDIIDSDGSLGDDFEAVIDMAVDGVHALKHLAHVMEYETRAKKAESKVAELEAEVARLKGSELRMREVFRAVRPVVLEASRESVESYRDTNDEFPNDKEFFDVPTESGKRGIKALEAIDRTLAPKAY